MEAMVVGRGRRAWSRTWRLAASRRESRELTAAFERGFAGIGGGNGVGVGDGTKSRALAGAGDGSEAVESRIPATLKRSRPRRSRRARMVGRSVEVYWRMRRRVDVLLAR